MLYFEWSTEKNQTLRRERDSSFEEIVLAINRNQLLAVVSHPNQEKYPNQQIYIVNIDNYAYLVPFVQTGDIIFMKTVIPSRKATKEYLGGK